MPSKLLASKVPQNCHKSSAKIPLSLSRLAEMAPDTLEDLAMVVYLHFQTMIEWAFSDLGY